MTWVGARYLEDVRVLGGEWSTSVLGGEHGGCYSSYFSRSWKTVYSNIIIAGIAGIADIAAITECIFRI